MGLTDGTDAGREAVKWFAEQILKLDEQLAEIEGALHKKCKEIPYAENILEINGVGENILAGILAEMETCSGQAFLKCYNKVVTGVANEIY